MGGQNEHHGPLRPNPAPSQTVVRPRPHLQALRPSTRRTSSASPPAASILSATGVIHAYALTETGVANRFELLAAPQFAFAYGIVVMFLLAVHATGHSSSDVSES